MITIRSVQGLKPGSTLWDNSVPGFGVRKQRRDAVYVIKYRVFGRQRFVTIGKHGHWTPDTARREARRLLGLVAAGKDPQFEKEEAREQAADTLGRVIDLFLVYAKAKQKPRSFVETQRHLKVNWLPLHPVSIFHLTRRQVAARLTELGGYRAARARSALSAMFNWAIGEGYDVVNPVLGTNRQVEKSRDRVLTDAELKAIWDASGPGPYGRIVRLLMLTGQRRDEVGQMKLSEITGDLWTIPASRTKNHREHTIPLAPVAMELVGDFSFSGWSKSKVALDARLEIAPWRLHDLRRTAATKMGDLGVAPYIIEAVLNHVSGHKAGAAGIYNRARYEVEVRQALTLWGDYVHGLLRSVSGNQSASKNTDMRNW